MQKGLPAHQTAKSMWANNCQGVAKGVRSESIEKMQSANDFPNNYVKSVGEMSVVGVSFCNLGVFLSVAKLC